MASIEEKRNFLNSQSKIYEGKVRESRNKKKRAERSLFSLRKKKSEREIVLEKHRKNYEKIQKINKYLNKRLFFIIYIFILALFLIRLLLEDLIVSLSGLIFLPMVSVLGVLTLTSAAILVSNVLESKLRSKISDDERSLNTYNLRIAYFEKEIEKCISDKKVYQAKKDTALAGLKEIDEFLNNLDIDILTNEGNGLNNQQNLEVGAGFLK